MNLSYLFDDARNASITNAVKEREESETEHTHKDQSWISHISASSPSFARVANRAHCRIAHCQRERSEARHPVEARGRLESNFLGGESWNSTAGECSIKT